MTLSQVNAVAGILSGVKINKIADKAVKAALVKEYIQLRKFVKDADEERREIVDKFQADWREELAPVEAFRKAGKPVVGHEAYLDAEKDANKAIYDLFSREVDIDITPVKMDAFIGSCEGDELTLEQVAVLQECGIIE